MTEGRGLPDLAWIRDVGRLDDDRLRAELKRLPVGEQVELVLSIGWQDRLRVIKNSERAAEVVKALPREELFLTIKSLEEDDALALFAHATPEQVRFILDIELWKRDEIDSDKVLTWLKHMLSAGESKVMEFVTTADMELLALLVRKLVYLVPNEEGVTIPDGLPGIMPDEFFTILSNFPEDTEAIGLFMKIVRHADRTLFYRMLFAAYGMAEPETQEEALRWRASRLDESGFLDFDEAVEIYGYIGEDEARRIARSPAPGSGAEWAAAGGEAAPVAPGYPVLLADRKGLFYEVLVSITDRALQNRLRQEIAFSANRLLVADAERIGEIAAIKQAVARFFSLVEIGLAFMSGGDKGDAARLLAEVPLKEIFQVGFSRLVDLKTAAVEHARRWWPEWATRGFGFLEPARDEMMKGLMMRVPQYYGSETGATGFRDFRTLDEVRAVRRSLEELEAVAEACFDKIGLPRPHEAKLRRAEVFALGIEDVTLSNLLTTGFVNFVLKGAFDVAPLTRGDAPGLLDVVMAGGPDEGRRVRSEKIAGFLIYLAGKTGFEGAKMERLARFVTAGTAELEAEVGRLREPADVDPRYIRSVLFR